MSAELMTLSSLHGAEISLTGDAFSLKFDLLAESSKITGITDRQSHEAAADSLRKISGLLSDIEGARKVVKAPVLELGKRIDETAKNYVSELDAEKSRLSKTIGAYVAEQERIRREEERKAREAELEPTSPIKPVVIAPSIKVAGTRVVTSRKFEIVDTAALFKSHPELFVPSEQLIREFVKSLPSADTTVDGLRIWEETKASAL